MTVEQAATSELPRSIRHGPRITLTCKCGEKNYLQYGERWTCDKCGRSWNTLRIPLEQYAEIRRTQLRFRRIPIAVSALSLVCIVAFVVAGRILRDCRCVLVHQSRVFDQDLVWSFAMAHPEFVWPFAVPTERRL